MSVLDVLDAYAVGLWEAKGGIALAACFCVFVWTLLPVKDSLDLHKIPAAPTWPIVGHLPYFFGNLNGADSRLHIFKEWADEYGPFLRISLGFGTWWVIVVDPVTTAQVVSRSGFDLPRHHQIYSNFNRVNPRDPHTRAGLTSMFTSPSNAYWKAVRKGVAPSFSSQNLRSSFRFVKQKCQEAADILASYKGSTFDADELALRLTMDIVGLVGFHRDFRALAQPDQPLLQTLPVVLDFLEARLDWPAWLPDRLFQLTKKGRHSRRCIQEFNRINGDLARQLRSGPAPSEDDLSIAAQLLRVVDPETGEPLSQERLQTELGNFLVAGFETSGHTLSYTLFELAAHPHVQDRVHEELAAAGLASRQGTHSATGVRELEYEDLGDLHYMNSVVKESMRMHAVGLGTLRQVGDKPVTLGPYCLPPGTPVRCSFDCTHMLQWAWDRPEQFNPDRWQHDDGFFTPDRNVPIPPHIHSSYADWYVWKQQQQQQHGDIDSSKVEVGKNSGAGDSSGSEPAQQSGPSSAAEQAEAEVNVPGSKTSVPGNQQPKTKAKGSVDEIRGGRARKFLPFSDGTRDCVGQAMANVQVRAVLAILLAKFAFRLAPEAGSREDVLKHEVISMTLHIRGGVKLQAHRRN